MTGRSCNQDADDHAFIPWWDGVGVRASCRCGWHSGYVHAVESYAQDDYDFHVNPVQRPPVEVLS